MPERSVPIKFQTTEEARNHFIKGAAVVYEELSGGNLTDVLKRPHNLSIKFSFDSRSQVYIPRDLNWFTRIVYNGRQVEIRTITAIWYVNELDFRGSICRHANLIDLYVGLPPGVKGFDRGGILCEREECYKSPTVRIDVDSDPFLFGVGKRPFTGDPSYSLTIPGRVPRKVIKAIGDVFGGLEGEFAPDMGVKQLVRVRARNAVGRIFPELHDNPGSPHRKIDLSDPDDTSHLLHI